MWKCDHKIFALLVILPTCLHGFVPAVHTALLMVIGALRQLDGEVISYFESKKRGLEPGTRLVVEESISRLGTQLVCGLVLLEGSSPVDHLNPALHHLVHYGTQTQNIGLLRWFSMRCFERNNKRIKGMVKGTSNPYANLANNIRMDIATRYLSFKDREMTSERPPPSVLYSRRRRTYYKLSQREKIGLAIHGITGAETAKTFDTARILGEHFKADEWGRQTCGSVITTIYGGRSRYCYVKRFLRVQNKSFASVVWLSPPEYPYHPNRLVVRVHLMSAAEQSSCRRVISVDRIEPCSVSVLPDADRVHYWMLRSKGYDRVDVQL
jgi:hypothetical protein